MQWFCMASLWVVGFALFVLLDNIKESSGVFFGLLGDSEAATNTGAHLDERVVVLIRDIDLKDELLVAITKHDLEVEDKHQASVKSVSCFKPGLLCYQLTGAVNGKNYADEITKHLVEWINHVNEQDSSEEEKNSSDLVAEKNNSNGSELVHDSTTFTSEEEPETEEQHLPPMDWNPGYDPHEPKSDYLTLLPPASISRKKNYTKKKKTTYPEKTGEQWVDQGLYMADDQPSLDDIFG